MAVTSELYIRCHNTMDDFIPPVLDIKKQPSTLSTEWRSITSPDFYHSSPAAAVAERLMVNQNPALGAYFWRNSEYKNEYGRNVSVIHQILKYVDPAKMIMAIEVDNIKSLKDPRLKLALDTMRIQNKSTTGEAEVILIKNASSLYHPLHYHPSGFRVYTYEGTPIQDMTFWTAYTVWQAYQMRRALAKGDDRLLSMIGLMKDKKATAQVLHKILDLSDERELDCLKMALFDMVRNLDGMTTRLLATTDAVFAYVDKRGKDEYWGVGEALEEHIKDGFWSGQNLYGWLLMEIRDELRKERGL